MGKKTSFNFVKGILFALMWIISFGVFAQRLSIKGTVKDTKGEPLIGVTVKIKGTSIGTVTDMNGVFTLSNVLPNATLEISYVGMKQVAIPVNGKTTFNIFMEEETKMLEEVQVVAYGSQKKVTVTGAISSVRGDDLVKVPVASLTNILAGMVTGVSTVQYSGQPGSDEAEIYVRGVTTLNNSSPLVQVDGVERSFSQLDPNEIESITVLKDASATAVFGVRGANGVILITTKRGSLGKPKISFSTSVGVQTPTKLLDFANSYQYASFYNEAQINDGVDPSKVMFQPNVMEAFRTHSDPILYPDMDWLDYVMKDGAVQSQHNVNISGGIDNLKYFVSVGVLTQGGLFKTFDTGYNFNFNYTRYNYRANLDIDLSKSTLLLINLGGRVEDRNTPISVEDQNQLFRQLYWATPFSGAGIVNGKWVKSNPDYLPMTGADGLNSYYGKGYNSDSKNVLNFDLSLTQKLDFLTKGLDFKIKGSYNSTYNHTKTRSNSIPYYTPVKMADGTIEYMKSGDDGILGYSESFGKARDWYAEASLNYNRTFGLNSVGALLLYNQSKTYYPSQYPDIPSGYVGLVSRLTYDWNNRYMGEINIGYNGSENFAPNKRYGFFPAGSLGWVISEENFMKNIKNVVNYLKLRVSYGIVGNDKYSGQRFMYIPDSYVLGGSGYNFGTNVSSNKPGAYESKKSNPDVTWEKAYKQNYGFDTFFLNERLNFSADLFKERRKDILVQSEKAPGILGMSLPVINLGIVDSHGYEFTLKWSDKIKKDFRYWINGNLSYSRNKIIEKGEVKPDEDYMWETGKPVGTNFVYKFWGFYDDTANERYKAQYGEDIAEHAGGLKPGDCVYVDLNKDGIIDADDVFAAGYTNNPEYVTGLNLGLAWKNFEVNMQWTGAFNTSRLLQETYRQPLGDTNQKGLLLYQYEQRWTPETASTAKLPRATIASKSNNYKNSTLFLVNADYIRLKNMEIAYNMKIPFLTRAGINNCRIYVNGYNLLTFSQFKWGDPESRTTDRPNYPLTRVFNLGLKFDF